MSTPIKGSFLFDFESLLHVPQPQRTEPLRVPIITKRSQEGPPPQVLGPQEQLDSLGSLLQLPCSELRPAWTHPFASPVKCL